MLKPDKVRVSLGTAAVLGLEYLNMDEAPTTAYLQTYFEGRCAANCKFCAQAKHSTAELDQIARGVYPPYNTDEIIDLLKQAAKLEFFRRVCIQTMNYPKMLDHLYWLVGEISPILSVSVSLSAYPKKVYEKLNSLGVDMITIPLDAANPDLFSKIKGKEANGPYTWGRHNQAIEDALAVLGKGKVGTHLIVGLGETDEDLVRLIQELHDKGVCVSLFAFTQIPGTQLEIPTVDADRYRKVQFAEYLITNDIQSADKIDSGDIIDFKSFNIPHKQLWGLISSGDPFKVRGCPGCNRPFATETPSSRGSVKEAI